MPDLIIPEGFALVEIPHTHPLIARQAVVTFGVNLTGTPTATQANALLAAYQSAFASTLDIQVSVGPVTMRVGSASGENLVISGNTTFLGTSNRPDSLNPGQAVLMHKRTARGGRRGRGRMYLPWAIGDDSVDEAGRLSSGSVTAFNTRGSDFLTNISNVAEVDDMYLLHGESSPDAENPTTPGAPNEVTSLTVDPIVGSQRRRLGR